MRLVVLKSVNVTQKDLKATVLLKFLLHNISQMLEKEGIISRTRINMASLFFTVLFGGSMEFELRVLCLLSKCSMT
jgi:hypothetical protein